MIEVWFDLCFVVFRKEVGSVFANTCNNSLGKLLFVLGEKCGSVVMCDWGIAIQGKGGVGFVVGGSLGPTGGTVWGRLHGVGGCLG